ncbi:uncharacterized protein LOC144123019 [Amblyomma americanum]
MLLSTFMITVLALRALPANQQRLKSNQSFDVCAEKLGIVQKAKGAQLAANMVDKCFLPVAGKYKFTPKMFQKGIFKMCVVFRFCFHKYFPGKSSSASEIDTYRDAAYDCIAKMASLLTVDLNPEWIEKRNMENPKGLYYEGAECAKKHRIFPEDPAIAMFALKWVRDTLF